MFETEDFLEKDWLVTGGTGSVGSLCVKYILDYYEPKRVRVLTNNEYELWLFRDEMRGYPGNTDALRYLLKDITDYPAMCEAVRGVDFVINCAAVKHVFFAEYNPITAKQVNIDGTLNLIMASLNANVKRFVNISTDKACMPTTFMGMTKAVGERLVAWASKYRPVEEQNVYTNVRFGNVFGSRGSVIERWYRDNPIEVSDPNMRRFFMLPHETTQLIFKAMETARGGEIFVMKMPVIVIGLLAKVFEELYGKKIVYTEPITYEKIDEYLLSEAESWHRKEDESFIIISNDYPKADEPMEYSTVNQRCLKYDEVKAMVRAYEGQSRL